MVGKIYKITNIVNNKNYIGKTYIDIDKRFQQHIRESRRGRCKNRPLYAAINKYGISNFTIGLLGEFEEGLLEEKELEFIAEYNTYSEGYNATLGGDGRRYKVFTDEEVIKAYEELGYVNKVAEVFKCHSNTIQSILRNNGISIVQCHTRPIRIIETGEEFISVAHVVQWIVSQGLTDANILHIERCILRVLNGQRKSYLKLTFKYC